MSADKADHALLDCGGGRRLERFGTVLVSRPAPGAQWRRGLPESAWNAAELSFTRETGWRGEAPPGWRVRLGGVVMGLRPAAAGQVGVFPEHAAVAGRILDRAVHIGNNSGGGPVRVLNLFAHTGLATLMLAAGGDFEIVHVDGAVAPVKQARENAALSGLADKPIRWLTDDALGFLRRETRRGNRYDIILADPPAFGRGGKKGGEWRLERDLPELLALADSLLDPGGLLALTCHSEGWDSGGIAATVREHTGLRNIEGEQLLLRAETDAGMPLPGGQLLLARAR
jgi:23S rRNA (cytosine1962-C5)-methyltransferase